jgi:hypothetical protein
MVSFMYQREILEDNSKLTLRDAYYEDMNLIHLHQDKVRWWAFLCYRSAEALDSIGAENSMTSCVALSQGEWS